MKKKVILHVGMAKTATTSIQNTLAENRDLLSRAGVRFASFTLNGKDLPNHGLAVNYLFSRSPTMHHVHAKKGLDLAAEKARAEQELLAALNGPEDTVILSAETISLMNSEEMAAIRDRFAALDTDLRVVCFLRPTLGFLISFAQQSVKSGAPMRIIYERAPAPTVRRVSSVFPQAQFFNFKEAVSHPRGPTAFLLEQLGIDVSLQPEKRAANESWSDNAARFAGHLNHFAPTVTSGRMNKLRREADIRIVSAISGPRFSLTKSELDRDRVESGIAWLVKTYGDSYSERFDDLPDQPAPWGQEQIAQAARVIGNLPPALVPLANQFFQCEAVLEDGATLKPVEAAIRRAYFS